MGHQKNIIVCADVVLPATNLSVMACIKQLILGMVKIEYIRI
jgi:hypothetical protein